MIEWKFTSRLAECRRRVAASCVVQASCPKRPRPAGLRTELIAAKRPLAISDTLPHMSMIEPPPKKFVARKTSREFVLFGDYLVLILMSAVIFAGVALIYLAMNGRAVLGSLGLASWLLVPSLVIDSIS